MSHLISINLVYMSYTNSLYHLVIRPKDSKPVITEKYERDLYAYINGLCKNNKCTLYRINGMPDHLHMLLELSPTIALSDFVKELKLSTHQFIKAHPSMYPSFEGWGREYFAVTYNYKDREMIRQYIINQKEHHRTLSFKEELRKLLIESGVPYKEEYL